MGGANNYRPIWQQHVNNIDAIIFVLDSSDRVRFLTAAGELHSITDLPQIQNSRIPILILANKNDIEGSAPLDIIERDLRVSEFQNHPVLVKSVCSLYPNDIFQSIEWLIARH